VGGGHICTGVANVPQKHVAEADGWDSSASCIITKVVASDWRIIQLCAINVVMLIYQMAKRRVVCADASTHAGYASKQSLESADWTLEWACCSCRFQHTSAEFERNPKFSWRFVMSSESASYASMLMHTKSLVSQNDGSLRRLRSANTGWFSDATASIILSQSQNENYESRFF
jgi:hypothetical protein